ncbi:MAG: polysaccharide pyruvyl transferase family protein [Kiritimatiellia bacterium]
MRIGLLTYHSVFNFGANLQALSTISYLRAQGHEVKVIDWAPHREMALYRQTPAGQQAVHRRFFESHYELTDPCADDRDVARAIAEHRLAGVVIGSDAVFQYVPWRTAFMPNRRGQIAYSRLTPDQRWPNPFLGTFMNGLRRPVPVAYLAVSAQNMDHRRISRWELGRFRKQFRRFADITVRDTWTQRLFERIFQGGVPPPIVPDPVLGLNQNYMFAHPQDVRRRFGLPEKYVLATFPGDAPYSAEWLEEFKVECERHGQACLALPLPRGDHVQFRDPSANLPLPLAPEQWYALLAGAAGYVGTNMHPVVVCLHNAVPFYSFDSYGLFSAKKGVESLGASKVFDLLNRAGLLDCYHNAWWPAWPRPADVFGRLQAFDRGRCAQLAALRRREYEAGMERLLRSLAAAAAPME